MKKLFFILFVMMIGASAMKADDGHMLWLGKLGSPAVTSVSSPMDVAAAELSGWDGPKVNLSVNPSMQPESFLIIPTNNSIEIIGGDEKALMYGVYRLKIAAASGRPITASIAETPQARLRMLNHWDNLDGTIERGYAGSSLWQWADLPDSISPRYQEYARANASIGINATVLNNVNASPAILSNEYLQRVAAIASALRPYGIRVFLSVNFASPMVLGGLDTADPLSADVVKWWQEKALDIYSLIPDFGGFLVKANSEGQPGPCDFGRTHAEGANMLAAALQPFGGTVIWRAFVYSPSDDDRAKQAYLEFKPLDGEFSDNVIVQIKNGPIDFQPREPYSPLFDGLNNTRMAAELQITQEYLGHSNHLVYLSPMWSEFFSYVNADKLSAIAGVSNIGDAPSWTGHPFAQANWYAFGRLVWNPRLSPEEIADEWLKLTLYPSGEVADSVHDSLKQMMLSSHEAAVNYMMPMGLHHIFAFGHHYGPEPWCDVEGARADWLPRYYHQADSIGLGFDRSATGSNTVGQYAESFASQVADVDRCPKKFLLWFHHVPWQHRLADGHTMWDSLCLCYQAGVDAASAYSEIWEKAQPWVDPEIFHDVATRLQIQKKDAQWWKDACLLYFQEFSKMPLPSSVTAPNKTLQEFEQVNLGISNYEAPSSDLLDQQR